MGNPNPDMIEQQAAQESGLFPDMRNGAHAAPNTARGEHGLPAFNGQDSLPVIDTGVFIRAQSDFLEVQRAFMAGEIGQEDLLHGQSAFIKAQAVALRQAGIA